jgi:tRNA(Ile)-lysidine synthase
MPLPDLTIFREASLAVGVSGGRDSMALVHMLKQAGVKLYALTVDHGLRQESSDEAAQVSQWMKEWNIPHTILTWEGTKPETGIQDAARQARYRLMADFCQQEKISSLALAHHSDDQIETFLHRLTKGSGLNGLTGMKAETPLFGVTLVRPLLNMSRKEITSYCAQYDIPFIDDPSNEKEKYTRVRFRKFMQSEGLDDAAMQRTIARLSRASDALESQAMREWKNCIINQSPLTLDKKRFLKQHDEIQIRILNKALQTVTNDFRPTRLFKIEESLPIISSLENGKAYTIGGCLILQKDNNIVIEKEARQ